MTLRRRSLDVREARPATRERVLDSDDDDGADRGDEETPDVESVDPGGPHEMKEEAADDRADDAKHDVDEGPLAPAIHDLACNESCDETENDPSDDGHDGDLRWWLVVRVSNGRAKALIALTG